MSARTSTRRTKGNKPEAARWRLAASGAVLALVWAALWVRAGQVQLVLGPELAAKAKQQYVASETSQGRRGNILDRNGVPLARSVRVSSVSARPAQMENPRHAARLLAKALGLPRKQLARKLARGGHFVWLARQVDDRTRAAVQALDLKGVEFEEEFTRVYPAGPLAGQVLGFTDVDGRGREGLEGALDERLAGRSESRVLQKDASGRRMETGVAERLLDGQDVWLTLDSHVQAEAEKALARAVDKNRAAWGACLVVDVPSGEILAMANYPFFNPNTFRHSSPARRRNRAALDIFEPGSTVKALLAAAALEDGLVTPDTMVDCEGGRYVVTGKAIRDTHEYDDLSVSDVVALSSNIGSAKIGAQLGAQRLYDYLRRLGFGAQTDLPLYAQAQGLLRDPGGWYPLDLATISFGQGMGVTALQLAQAYLALAGDGTFRPLRLTRNAPAYKGERIFPAATAAQVRAMLVRAVEEGTGKNGRLPGVVVGGKTGTAQKASPQGGYSDSYVASFVAMVPGNAPELLVLAVIDSPKEHHYGGVVAAPAVRDVMAGTLAYTGMLTESVQAGSFADVLASTGEGMATMECGPGFSGAACPSLPGLPALTVQEETVPALPSEIEALAAQLAGSAEKDVPRVDDKTMPDVVGVSLQSAVAVLVRRGAVPQVRGLGPVVVGQSPKPGARWTSGKTPVLTLGQGGQS